MNGSTQFSISDHRQAHILRINNLRGLQLLDSISPAYLPMRWKPVYRPFLPPMLFYAAIGKRKLGLDYQKRASTVRKHDLLSFCPGCMSITHRRRLRCSDSRSPARVVFSAARQLALHQARPTRRAGGKLSDGASAARLGLVLLAHGALMHALDHNCIPTYACHTGSTPRFRRGDGWKRYPGSQVARMDDASVQQPGA